MYGQHLLIDYDHGSSGEFLTKELSRILGCPVPFYTLNGRTKVQDAYEQELLKIIPEKEKILSIYQKVKFTDLVVPTHRHTHTYQCVTGHPSTKVLRVNPPKKYIQHVIENLKRKVWYSSFGGPGELKGWLDIMGIPLSDIGKLTHKNRAIDFLVQSSGSTIGNLIASLAEEIQENSLEEYAVVPGTNTLCVAYDDLMFDSIEESVARISNWIGRDMQRLVEVIKEHVSRDKECNIKYQD